MRIPGGYNVLASETNLDVQATSGSSKTLSTGLGYELSSDEKFSYNNDEAGTFTLSNLLADVNITGKDTDNSTITIKADNINEQSSNALIPDSGFTGNSNLTLDADYLDISNIIPSTSGSTVTVANVTAGNVIEWTSAKLSTDKYVYPLYLGGSAVTKISNKSGTYEVASDGLLTIKCIEKADTEITLHVSLDSDGVASPSVPATDAAEITSAVDDGASSISVKLNNKADILEISNTTLISAFKSAIDAGIPLTLVLNDKTTVTFPEDSQYYKATNSLKIVASRSDAETDSFVYQDNKYTPNGFGGTFSITADKVDVTDSFNFALSDLDTSELTEYTDGADKYSLFATVTSDKEGNVTGVTEIPYASNSTAFAGNENIVFAKGGDWYIFDRAENEVEVTFSANIPDGYTGGFEEPEEDSDYEINDDGALVAKISGSDKVTVPGADSVSCANGKKPYALYGWISKPLDAYKSSDLAESAVTDAVNGGAKYLAATDATVDDENEGETYYAVWYADEAKVTFDLNFDGATLNDFGYYKTSVYTKNTKTNQVYATFENAADTNEYSAPGVKANANSGYSFVGWATEADATEAEELNQFSYDYDYAGGNTYYAVWEKGETTSITVKFDANNGEFTAVPEGYTEVSSHLISISFDEDDTGSAAVPSAEYLSRDGYTLAGWSTTANGEADADLTEVSFDTSDATFYAVWEAEEVEKSVEVDFDANGGYFLSVPDGYTVYDDEIVYVTFENSDAAAADIPTVSRNGYTFKGWEDASGTEFTAETVSYETGDAYYYAVWEAEETESKTSVSVNEPEKETAALTINGTSVSVNYYSKQLYQGRKLKNFDAIESIEIGGVSYNGADVKVKTTKEKDAGSKVTVTIRKIKGADKTFNKALKSSKPTLTVELKSVSATSITTSKPSTYSQPGTIYVKERKNGKIKAWLVTKKNAKSTKAKLVKIKNGYNYDSSTGTITFTGNNIEGSAKKS